MKLSDSSVVFALDLKTVCAVDFSMDECNRWGVNNRVELEKMTNFDIFKFFV